MLDTAFWCHINTIVFTVLAIDAFLLFCFFVVFVLSYCYLSSLISQVKTNTPNQVVRCCDKSGENAEDLMDEIRRLYMNNQLLMQEIEELKTQLLKITLKYQIQKRKQENFKEQNNVIREIAIVKPFK